MIRVKEIIDNSYLKNTNHNKNTVYAQRIKFFDCYDTNNNYIGRLTLSQINQYCENNHICNIKFM
jgi:hypothetical protein